MLLRPAPADDACAERAQRLRHDRADRPDPGEPDDEVPDGADLEELPMAPLLLRPRGIKTHAPLEDGAQHVFRHPRRDQGPIGSGEQDVRTERPVRDDVVDPRPHFLQPAKLWHPSHHLGWKTPAIEDDGVIEVRRRLLGSARAGNCDIGQGARNQALKPGDVRLVDRVDENWAWTRHEPTWRAPL